MNKYTIKQFNEDYPSDDVCLEAIFQNRYGHLEFCPNCGAETTFYRLKGRKAYSCMHCRHQLHPLAGTIFHKSETPLRSWFFAIYLFSVSKNGVSAKELERHLGVTYKTAWRIAKHIRMLMQQSNDKLSGIVEADETYIGGRTDMRRRFNNKSTVMGIVEKKGKAKAVVTNGANATIAVPFLRAAVEVGTEIHTDDSRIYNRVKRDFKHRVVNHSAKEYVKDGVHTNSIEGLWGQMKRSMDGTYHCVSPKYLQSYVNEFVYRYNRRDFVVYPEMILEAGKPIV
jgi:transposase